MMRIGLYFGSFNPVHYGHLAIAQFLKDQEWFDQIWMIVSPNNPLKDVSDLASAKHRLNMVKLAIQDFPFMRACDVEFSLPTPSYTINTLNFLDKEFPNYEFALILGADNMETFHKWKDYEQILERYMVYVYPRTNTLCEKRKDHIHIKYIDAQLLQVSSTEIRSVILQKKLLTSFLPESVISYIEEQKIY